MRISPVIYKSSIHLTASSAPQTHIYFYTIKPILPNTELLVWYCKEFATRLNYPLTGELGGKEVN